MFKGAITALATPMRQGEVYRKGLQELVEFQISEGINGLVPCGSTGETATLTREEQATVIRTVAQQAKGRVPVIAGAGTNSTRKAIQLSKMAHEAGADALLHVTPYYNRPTPEGLVEHYRAITEASELPIVIYNVPSRTGCDIQPDTIATIARLPHVVGIKEATGSLARGQQIIAQSSAEFVVLSGDDGTSFALSCLGGAGVISVVSNIVPKAMAQMIAAALAGKLAEGRSLHYKLLPLINLMAIKTNPIPVKAAVSLLGYSDNEVRLPLVPLAGEPLEKLQAEMRRQGLLS